MKKSFLALLVFTAAATASASSVIDSNRESLKVLFAEASSIAVKGDIKSDKLSDVLAEALYTNNNDQVSLKVYNSCDAVLGGKGTAFECRLSIMDSDGETESAVIIEYMVDQDSKSGKLSVRSKVVNSWIAG